MPEEITWYTEFCDGKKRARSPLYFLETLAVAFRRTGNDEVAEELLDISEGIGHGIQAMDDAVSRLIHEESKAAQEDLLAHTALAVTSIVDSARRE